MTSLNRTALAVLAFTGVLQGVMIVFSAGQEEVFDTVLYATLPLTLATVGALMVSRVPGNPIGWLFVGLGLFGAVTELAEGWGYRAAEWGLPGGVVGEWLITWSWICEITGWIVIVLLFPDGRPRGRRPAITALAISAGFVLAFVGQGLDPDRGDQFTAGENPLAVESPLIGVALVAGLILLIGTLIAAVASAFGRFRHARGVERQQLKWFAYAGLILAVLMPVAGAFWYASAVVQVLVGLALNLMPLAVGAAILRYRLYDIDVVINRTLVYGVLSASLAATYLASVVLLQLALSPLTSDSGLAVAGSTLAVAALFRPARARIQALVDRRFYRRRYDAQLTLAAFSARLRDEIELEALSAELSGVVRGTMQPAHVSLWLRTPEARR